MLRVVLDTNIYISAILYGGNPERIFNLARIGKIDVYVSKPILIEIDRVLRQKLNQPEDRVKMAILEIQSITRLINPKVKVSRIKSDEPDNRILECGLECRANCIISGDKHLLKLREYRGIKIINPSNFINNTFP